VATWALGALDAAVVVVSRDEAASAARAAVADLGRDELLRVVGCLADLATGLIPAQLARGKALPEVLETYRFVVVIRGDQP
jgi:hypothetical protein